MTHEELRAKIKNTWADDEFECSKALYALRAVVELHKPNIKGGCDICSWIINGFVLYEVCPTIQAIEKALTTNVDN